MLFTLGGGGGDNRHLSRIRIEMLQFASLLRNTGDKFLTFQHFIHSFESMQLSTLVLLHIIKDCRWEGGESVFLSSTKVVEQSSNCSKNQILEIIIDIGGSNFNYQQCFRLHNYFIFYNMQILGKFNPFFLKELFESKHVK